MISRRIEIFNVTTDIADYKRKNKSIDNQFLSVNR